MYITEYHAEVSEHVTAVAVSLWSLTCRSSYNVNNIGICNIYCRIVVITYCMNNNKKY